MADTRWLGALFGGALVGGALIYTLRPSPATASPRAPARTTATDPPRRPAPVARPSATSASLSAIDVNENDPQIVRWQPAMIAATALAGDPPGSAPIPWRVGMAWLAIESGGNPCAVGGKTATGPDGFPREIGLVQMYNADDFKATGSSPSELVAYCARPSVGPRSKRCDDGGYRDGSAKNPQKLTRPMTTAELQRAVQLSVASIAEKRAIADRKMAAAGITWPSSSRDYWSMVKAYHAYPPIVNQGIPKVMAALGRAPGSWKEFRDTLELLEPTARFNAKLETQGTYYRGLRNAEWVGSHAPSAT